MTRIEPVWLSTDEQIAAVTRIYTEASLAAKLLGTFDIPPGVAHLQGVFMPWMRTPIAFVAEGKLKTDGERIAFVPKPFRAFGWRVEGLRSDAGFDIPVSAVTAIEPVDLHSPVGRFFDIPFTRIRTTLPAPLDNLLLCVGGRISPARVRERSMELRRELETLARS